MNGRRNRIKIKTNNDNLHALLDAVKEVFKSYEYYTYVSDPVDEPELDEYDLMMSPIWNRLNDEYERGNRMIDPEDKETIMKQWDYWRNEITNGHEGTAPRDWFESILDYYDDTGYKCSCPRCLVCEFFDKEHETCRYGEIEK